MKKVHPTLGPVARQYGIHGHAGGPRANPVPHPVNGAPSAAETAAVSPRNDGTRPEKHNARGRRAEPRSTLAGAPMALAAPRRWPK
jgi:hypothetical protein